MQTFFFLSVINPNEKKKQKRKMGLFTFSEISLFYGEFMLEKLEATQ